MEGTKYRARGSTAAGRPLDGNLSPTSLPAWRCNSRTPASGFSTMTLELSPAAPGTTPLPVQHGLGPVADDWEAAQVWLGAIASRGRRNSPQTTATLDRSGRDSLLCVSRIFRLTRYAFAIRTGALTPQLAKLGTRPFAHGHPKAAAPTSGAASMRCSERGAKWATFIPTRWDCTARAPCAKSTLTRRCHQIYLT